MGGATGDQSCPAGLVVWSYLVTGQAWGRCGGWGWALERALFALRFRWRRDGGIVMRMPPLGFCHSCWQRKEAIMHVLRRNVCACARVLLSPCVVLCTIEEARQLKLGAWMLHEFRKC